MRKDFDIRLYQTGEEEAIIEVLKYSFPDWSKKGSPLDYWKRKTLDTPFGSIAVVVVSNNKIIGNEHEIKLNIKIGDTIVLSQYGDDTSIHPDYRGMGLYAPIADMRERERAHTSGIYFSLFCFTTYEIMRVDDLALYHFKKVQRGTCSIP